MPITSETVTLAGSGLVFRNTYGSDVTDAYRASILTAENYLQSHFSNAITINAVFGTESLGAENAAATNHFFVVQLGYSALKDALTSHATTSDDLTAVFGLPLTDPSNGAFFDVPVAEARVLGFNVSPAPFDVKVLLSSDETWSYGQDVVGPLLHEITEGGFGRVGSLGLTGSPDWAPMDLFRFTAAGVRDFTGGRDGVPTFFGLDSSHVSALAFHNAIDATGAFDHQDLADWDATFDDAFGPGGPGFPTSVSATDLQVLDVLGWTPNTLGQVANPHDDFASGFSDTSHPMGQIAMGGMATGDLEVAGDRDWFQVTLGPGDYLIGESGHSGGGGSLVDPFLRVYDSTGTLVRQADDIIPGQDLDSRLIMHVSTSETFYIEAGSGQDQGAGTYTVALAQGAGDTTSGSDLMLGQIGGSTIDAGAGDDSIMGRDSPNFLRGNDGDDVIFGGAAFDDINGNKGQDTAHGGEGGDWVVGGQGNDMLFGDDGDDIVYGNLGNDTCDGGSGNDLIRGGQGDDVLTGGDGNDWLSGDRGSDTLTGGAGADTFHTFSGAGIDIVTDFNAGEGDRVQVDAGTNYTVSQQGADVVIDMQNGDELVLKNVTLSTLPATWIFTL